MVAPVAAWMRPLPERLAGLGVLGLGMAWSLGVAVAHWQEIHSTELPLAGALLLTTAGSTLTVAGVWFGVGAVVWAMARLLGGKAGFVRVLFAVSAAAPPLWIAAPVLVFALANPNAAAPMLGLAVVGPAAAVDFVMLLISTLVAVEGFSGRRAGGCAALTAVFCASCLSLV